jgi:hypothetical protein
MERTAEGFDADLSPGVAALHLTPDLVAEVFQVHRADDAANLVDPRRHSEFALARPPGYRAVALCSLSGFARLEKLPVSGFRAVRDLPPYSQASQSPT